MDGCRLSSTERFAERKRGHHQDLHQRNHRQHQPGARLHVRAVACDLLYFHCVLLMAECIYD